MGCAGRSRFCANVRAKPLRGKGSAPAQPQRHFGCAPGEGQQKREVAHGAARRLKPGAARLEAHAHRALRDNEGGVLVKGAAHVRIRTKQEQLSERKMMRGARIL
jgi:hypothetical protein